MARGLTLVLVAAAAVAVVGSAAHGAPDSTVKTQTLKLKAPAAGDVTVAHFLVKAKTKKAAKKKPAFKIGNRASLGADFMVVASVKRPKKGTWDVTAVVAHRKPPAAFRVPQRGDAKPVLVVIDAQYAVVNPSQIVNTVEINRVPTFACNPAAAAAAWYRGASFALTPAAQPFEFGCETARELPFEMDYLDKIGGQGCWLGGDYFMGQKTEDIFRFQCNMAGINAFELDFPAGTTITNHLAPPGFACHFQGAEEQCVSANQIPPRAVVQINLRFTAEVQENSFVGLKLSLDHGATFPEQYRGHAPD